MRNKQTNRRKVTKWLSTRTESEKVKIYLLFLFNLSESSEELRVSDLIYFIISLSINKEEHQKV